mmetsp:Transcript_15057/g.30457  ORF Transcript_15057/g.30457 Transcript_15057/m.30457 type:complete len:249 (+) Transcript_15057:67-813(+)
MHFGAWLAWLQVCALFIYWAEGSTVSERRSMAIEQFTGTAYTDETMQTVLYEERHLVMHNDRGEPSHSMVLYTRPTEGPKVFANLRSDFTRGRNVSIYEFHDYALQWKEGIKYEDGRYVMYRGEGELPLEKKELSMDASNLFAGEGWHYFLLDRLDMLAQKAKKPSPFTLHLCFPAHLANYPFILKRVRAHSFTTPPPHKIQEHMTRTCAGSNEEKIFNPRRCYGQSESRVLRDTVRLSPLEIMRTLF